MATKYPGEGHKMSSYGVKTYTHEQIKEQWRESIRAENRLRDSHLITAGTSESLSNAWCVKSSPKPATADLKSLNYFNTNKEYKVLSPFDRTFHITEGYCSKLHLDDREHTRGLNVNAEERQKAVPVLTSSLYGLRPQLELSSRQHVRVATVQRDFYRHCGTNIPLGTK